MALLTCIINIYTAQSGDWSVSAVVTVVIVGVCIIHMGSMVVVYQFWYLRKLKEIG